MALRLVQGLAGLGASECSLGLRLGLPRCSEILDERGVVDHAA